MAKVVINIPKSPKRNLLRFNSQIDDKRAPTSKHREKRLHARAVKRIFDRKTGELVGWLYEWNTGATAPRWVSKPYDDVTFD